jgi:hypothetical protein
MVTPVTLLGFTISSPEVEGIQSQLQMESLISEGALSKGAKTQNHHASHAIFKQVIVASRLYGV